LAQITDTGGFPFWYSDAYEAIHRAEGCHGDRFAPNRLRRRCRAARDAARRLLAADINRHRAQPIREIHIAGSTRGTITMRVVVSPLGVVESATALDGPSEFFAQAEKLERDRKFAPFQQHGAAVRATEQDFVMVLPLEQWGKRAPFPDVQNMATLRMTLARSMCLGPCPAYTVEIRGDGTVQFEGLAHVDAMGSHSDRISRDAAAELLAAFRRADFFSLQDEYAAMVADIPTFTVSIEFDGRKKSVRDHMGLSMGMPEAAADLEEAFDRLADTVRWLRGPAVR
jgi:hypothetical protein